MQEEALALGGHIDSKGQYVPPTGLAPTQYPSPNQPVIPGQSTMDYGTYNAGLAMATGMNGQYGTPSSMGPSSGNSNSNIMEMMMVMMMMRGMSYSKTPAAKRKLKRYYDDSGEEYFMESD